MGDSSTSYQQAERRNSDHSFDSDRSRSHLSLYSVSSEESLPLDAPLARQPRCSIDIDTIESIVKPTRKNGINERENAYLDSAHLSDSIQEIS